MRSALDPVAAFLGPRSIATVLGGLRSVAAVPGGLRRVPATGGCATVPGALALLPLLLASCSSTSMVSVWRDPSYGGDRMTKVAVFVLAKEPAVQKLGEDGFVRRMPAGTQCVPAHALFAPEELKDREKVKAKLLAQRFDGALVARLVTVDKSLEVIPPSPPSAYPGGFSGYYGRYAPAYYGPGRVEVTTAVTVESLLYSLAADKLVWVGTSKTVDPPSTPELIEGVIEATTSHLEKEGLVGSRPPK